jgi:hypothetical protein
MNYELITNKVKYSAGAIKKIIKPGQERQSQYQRGD